MATKVETMPVSTLTETPRDSPPTYESVEDLPITPTSSSASLPHYDAVVDPSSSSTADASGFFATRQLQIQAAGIRVVRFPVPPRNTPIYVFSNMPSGDCDAAEYISIRPSRESGSCFLTRADDSERAPLCRTTYRFGPGKPPKVQLLQPLTTAGEGGDGDEIQQKEQQQQQQQQQQHEEEFTLEGAGHFTRATKMRTSLGTFEWRYAGKAERAAAQADSLLVLDRLTSVALEGGKTEVRRLKVAQLVRNEALRTAGTRRSTAGNGGRLMLDMRDWADSKGGDAAQVEVLVVTTCLAMLKKEVDRRRLHQTVALMAGASGGA